MVNGVENHNPDEKPTWTIMLYLSGDNNLSEDMVRALNDIKMQGVPDEITLTIQYDPRSPGFDTFRYAITSTKPPATKALENEVDGPLPIPEYLVERLEDEDSADPRVLARFIRWSLKSHWSTYRMLILSGHGSGAVGDFLSDDNAQGGRPRSLTIPLLAKALEFAEKGNPKYESDENDKGALAKSLEDDLLRSLGTSHLLNILGMDSCLMGMAEVAYEVRDHVDFLVGSEGFVPNAGWPYAHLLNELKKPKDELNNPKDMKPESVAGRLVKDVINYYEQSIPAGTSLDMASCNLRRLDPIAHAVKNLAATLKGHLAADNKSLALNKTLRDLVIVAHWRAQSYKFEQYTDLWDFCDLLQGAATQLRDQVREAAAQDKLKRITNQCNKVKDTIAAVAKPANHAGPEFQHSHGLSVFFPWSASSLGGDTLTDYGKLAFSKASEWSRFLDAYLRSSEREARAEDGALLPKTQRSALRPTLGPALGSGKHAEPGNKFAGFIDHDALCSRGHDASLEHEEPAPRREMAAPAREAVPERDADYPKGGGTKP